MRVTKSPVAGGVVPGPAGPQGPKGDPGVAGAASVVPGPAGAAGASGAASTVPGPQGLQGPTGLSGAKGDTGAPGLPGAVGPQGPIGLTGSTGPAGAQGLKGDTGAAGPQGLQGATGQTGAAGTTGTQGLQGLPGATGATGAVGAQGVTGQQGIPGWQRFKLTADVTNSTVTLADVTSLGFAMAASTDYDFEFFVPFQTAALTTGLALGLNGPGTPSLLAYRVEVPISVATVVLRYGNTYNAEALGTAVDTINVPRLATIQGVIRNGTTAGTLIARFRSEVAASAVVVKAGAVVRWQAI